MSECIICLDPCTDHTNCCKAPIHASCLCEILEKGFGKCPHCQKDLYPALVPPPAPEPRIQYMPLPVPVQVEEKNTYCKNVTQVIGSCVLFMMAMGLFSHVY